MKCVCNLRLDISFSQFLWTICIWTNYTVKNINEVTIDNWIFPMPKDAVEM